MARRDLLKKAIVRRRGLKIEELTSSCYPNNLSEPILGHP
jgi:hypothetical protein